MSALPDGLFAFLDSAGWLGAAVDPIPGDASFRRYFRIRVGQRKAMLMHAPPPEEDPQPFLHVAHWLHHHGLHVPRIYATDTAAGWVLLEDFGDDRMRDWLDLNPQGETGSYRTAIDALVALHTLAPGPFPPYDMAVYTREVGLFTEWYCPAMTLEVDQGGFFGAWEDVLAPLLGRQQPGVTVLRDYHAENIMLLAPQNGGTGPQGIIDFQDALVGHPAYDLVSLLQDARRDVSPQLERQMLAEYLAKTDAGPDFAADYACLGAQRNTKIVGIFARLWKRDFKPRYLSLIPRVWQSLERDLEHPALAPVAAWFDGNIPRQLRESFGGKIA